MGSMQIYAKKNMGVSPTTIYFSQCNKNDKKDIISSWNDLRPISIIPAWLTLLEKICLEVIKAQTNNLISGFQFAFKEGSYCSIAKLSLRYWAKKKGLTMAMLLDIKKAYDSVSWEKLINIVRNKLGEKSNLLLSFIEIYSHLQINLYGETINPMQGLPQGSSLSPLLFALYIDYSLEEMNSVGDCHVQAFADDTIVL